MSTFDSDRRDLQRVISEKVRSTPGFLANKTELTIVDQSGRLLKRTEERFRTRTQPSSLPDLWKKGPDGYWYLQNDGDEYSVEMQGDKGSLVDRQGEKTAIPDLEVVSIPSTTKESHIMYKGITAHLDRVANSLEAKGFLKEAAEVDVLSNTIEALAEGQQAQEPEQATETE
jgi:hypothetical protein